MTNNHLILVGGTQINTTIIASILRPHQGAVSAEADHIAVHDTGAIESAVHKVLPLPSEDGKIQAGQVRGVQEEHWSDSTHEYIGQPVLDYISNTTELETAYTKFELEELRRACDMTLKMDGVRLGCGLASDQMIMNYR